MPDNWTDAENETIVADYFAMLADEEAGQPYSKAEHNRRVAALTGRPRGSIEYKHQNISAVLKGLGETWIQGYKPAYNFQGSLVDAVAQWLALHPDWLSGQARATLWKSRGKLRENSLLWIGPPPTLSNVPPPDELDRMSAIAHRFDAAGRDERNRARSVAPARNVSLSTSVRCSQKRVGRIWREMSGGCLIWTATALDTTSPASRSTDAPG